MPTYTKILVVTANPDQNEVVVGKIGEDDLFHEIRH
jgi:hypothetical protein